jgi:histidine triad (HIT) family protein
MSLSGRYDRDNIFAKIVRGEAPCHRVWEDAGLLAFLDAFPQSEGHALVVPKHAAARTLFELEPAALCDLYRGVQIVAEAIRAVLHPDGVQIMQFNGAPAGQTVFHVHVHIVPRWSGEDPGLHASVPGDPAALGALATRLRAHFDAA